MNEFYIPSTKTVVSEAQLRAMFPRTSFPAILGPAELQKMGAAVVFAAPAPEITATQRALRNGVVPDGAGNWVHAWRVENFTAEEIAAQQAAAAEALQRDVVSRTQIRLDDWAATRNYDGILSACTYATSAVPKFAAEGQAAVNARDATWTTLYQILADVLAGKRAMPAGYAAIEPELPELVWGD